MKGAVIIELVQPIKEMEKIIELKRELLKRNYKYYMVCVMALNTGMRIGDIITLKVADVKNKTHIVIREEKTNKTKLFPINAQLRDEINQYIARMENEDYLFESRQKNNIGVKVNITRVQAYRYIKSVAEEIGIEHFGMHSFRKSFGYFYYQQTKDVAKLMQIFNHSSQEVTKRYIGLSQDEIDESLQNFFL
ncbi:integrase [Anaerosolibacter carboniphilus]|uniref:Integrase n=2 Tax=Anaerosolibacter carboniphilus TaxID=1417629 RepID=A0A841KP53_9FIRM|nr:integrase [Anaerosolibacter carboniphilus]